MSFRHFDVKEIGGAGGICILKIWNFIKSKYYEYKIKE